MAAVQGLLQEWHLRHIRPKKHQLSLFRGNPSLIDRSRWFLIEALTIM
jgi:hypothetical protein